MSNYYEIAPVSPAEKMKWKKQLEVKKSVPRDVSSELNIDLSAIPPTLIWNRQSYELYTTQALVNGAEDIVVYTFIQTLNPDEELKITVYGQNVIATAQTVHKSPEFGAVPPEDKEPFDVAKLKRVVTQAFLAIFG